MNYLDDENTIISRFQDVNAKEVYFPVLNKENEEMYNKIHSKDNWKKWINSSSKADLPPDFYSDDFEMMMDVMRIDDHAFVSNAGKVINPTNARESKIQKELKNLGYKELFPNAEFIVNAVTDLPTAEDHNYIYYLENFKRTVFHHKEHVKQYRRNHPGYKLIFFVCDESSAYIDNSSNQKPHIFILDEAFLNILTGIDIDYLIWYAPFKLLRTNVGIIELPKATIYNVRELDSLNKFVYDKKYMVSAEL